MTLFPFLIFWTVFNIFEFPASFEQMALLIHPQTA